ncbi:hypothetical protein K503DRAFT_861153 [Rhizopogon vinicolor AM-OR11-026]|uniref:RING-type domain-containing protein n=1 Tax=Rhizopogon vinicolor AM-OR11-026 TaxID=1314800 RepID=A0A1B7NJ35_9AGAM|nr:hypothetical protein K503DRAFT_861153 [Rhizopogon vinicolor AM-OR11-026]
MPQSDSDDEFPDDIGHLDLSNVPGLQELPVQSLIRPLNDALRPAVAASPSPLSRTSLPSEYDCDDEIDESILAACEALEAQFSQDRHRLEDSPSTAQPSTPTVTRLDTRKHGPPSPPSSPVSKKGRTSAEDRIKVENIILEGFETEINCPICFDVLVAAHLCNPCGHSCCGECVQGWVSQNKMSPTCPVCRTALSTMKPLLPNYALDAVVQQYVRALAVSGRSEWQEKGDRLAEWKKRHDKWKRLVAINVAQSEVEKAREDTRHRILRLQSAGPYMRSTFGPYLVRDDDDEDEDPTYEEDEPVEVLPRRIVLRRQRTFVS